MGRTLEGEQRQRAIAAIRSAIVGAPGITRQGLLTYEILEEPQFESILHEFLDVSVTEIENILKKKLSPKRKTDLPKSAREAYEDKLKYHASFPNDVMTYPHWDHLAQNQREFFGGDKHLYVDGSLDWDLLNKQQKQYLNSVIIFDARKIGPEEKIDGKGRRLITLKERPIIKIYRLALEVTSGIQGGIPFLNRVYNPETELIIYESAGDVQIMPVMARMNMAMNGLGFSHSTGYGQPLPNLPQILRIDYLFGYEEIPNDLLRAIALKVAVRTFIGLNLLLTKGLVGFSVQGFSAQFGQGLYKGVIEMYELECARILENYRTAAITFW